MLNLWTEKTIHVNLCKKLRNRSKNEYPVLIRANSDLVIFEIEYPLNITNFICIQLLLWRCLVAPTEGEVSWKEPSLMESPREKVQNYSPQLSQSFYEVVLGFLLFNKKSDQQFCAISIDIKIWWSNCKPLVRSFTYSQKYSRLR